MKKNQLMKQPYTQLLAVFLMFSPLACQKNNDSKAKVQGKQSKGTQTQCTADQTKEFNDKMNEITTKLTELKTQVGNKSLTAEQVCKDPQHEQRIVSCNAYLEKIKDLTCQSDKEVTPADQKTKSKAKTQKVSLKSADLHKVCVDYESYLKELSCKVTPVAALPTPAEPGTTTTTSTTTTSTTVVTPTTVPGGTPTPTTGTSTGTGQTATTAANGAGTDTSKAAQEAQQKAEANKNKYSNISTEACLKFVARVRATQRTIGFMIQNSTAVDAEKEYIMKSVKMNADFMQTHAFDHKIAKLDQAKRNDFNTRLANLGKMSNEDRIKLYRDIGSTFAYIDPVNEPKSCRQDAAKALTDAGITSATDKASFEAEYKNYVKRDADVPVYSVTAIEKKQIFITKVGGEEGVMTVNFEAGVPKTTRFYPIKVDKTVGDYKAMNFSQNLWMFWSTKDGSRDSFVYDADNSKKIQTEDEN